MKQKPPDNERRVLTWARDRQGIEVWQIDSYNKKSKWGDRAFWTEANAWDMTVLWWQELPPRRDKEGE